ncbi:hypothetical protein GCM10010259_39900 [Streptomyces daghestanicus]|nr:hypothetical protein GCM10010259_39900 [Streptomyces daghestanicus]
MLRPREGERPHSAARTTRPNHRRSPPSDNHWSRLTHITHNLPDRLRRAGEDPPVLGPAPLLPDPPGGDPWWPAARLAVGVREGTERGRSWCILGARTRGFVTGW